MSTTFLSEDTARYFEDQWIAHQLKEQSNGKYWFLNDSQFGKCKNDFWSIVSNVEWKRINFHFELRWKDFAPMTRAEKLNIRIHLETKYIDSQLDEIARTFFSEMGAVISSNPSRINTIEEVGGLKLDASVENPDFSSEEAAKQTVERIIAILNSDPYQKCAAIANAFLQAHH